MLAKDRLVVSAEPVAKVPGRGGATFRLQQLLGALPSAVVAGVPTVSRAVMNRAKGGALQLFAEGTNLKVGLLIQAYTVLAVLCLSHLFTRDLRRSEMSWLLLSPVRQPRSSCS